MKKILILITAIIMMVLLTSCFEKSSGSLNVSGSDTSTAGEKNGNSFSGEYIYNPPKDNYLVKWTYYNADGTEGGFDIYARIGQGHTQAMDTGIYHASDDMQKYYERAWEGEYSEWMVSPGYGYSDWLSDYDEDNPYIGNCGAMEDYFMHYFRAYGFDEVEGKMNDYFVGTEKICGVECWVFDTKGLNAIYHKYWIDPSNGCCLKYMDTEDGDYAIVTEYNLNYTQWTDNLAPSAYEGIDG